jgi:5,6,7,8-tetrahydromethanopterin hydro-lyase
VADSVADGVIPAEEAEDLCIVCGVFIHWDADDDKKIYDYNYEATKLAIANAQNSSPSAADMIAAKETAEHPYAGF